MERLRIIVSGFIGLYPTGGVTWDYIQYPLGLKLLGHDVFYIEDTRQYSTYQTAGKNWDDSSDTISYLRTVMEFFGLNNQWAYKDVASGKCFGLSKEKLSEVLKTADVFINISEATFLSDEYLNIPTKVLIDSDPMFTQVQYWNDENSLQSFQKIKKRYSAYDWLFTFGENISNPDCCVPTFGLNWIPTRQPICLPYWKLNDNSTPSSPFTTVMNWSTRKRLLYKKEFWGQKDLEFEKVISIPLSMQDSAFHVAISNSAGTHEKFKKESVEKAGWIVLNPCETIATAQDYQSFLSSSLAEFSVAKETYVKSNSGWFSCRSACYLATGKPVVTQQTGWTKILPSGLGLFCFTDKETAINALKEVQSNYAKHAKAARSIAEEYFNSDKVLQRLLNKL